jgi:hypothetical protein
VFPPEIDMLQYSGYFFLKIFILFSYYSFLIFDGLLTTLCLLDCIVPCLEHAEWCFSYLRFAYQIYNNEFALNIS